MVIGDMTKICKKNERIKEEILHWYISKEKVLNIISPPYNSCDIFLDVILYAVKQGDRVLYISTPIGALQIINSIKTYTNFRDYTFIKDNKSQCDSSLIVSDMNFVNFIEPKFDLVIFDSLNSICNLNYSKVRDICYKYCKYKGKILSYAIESVFDKEKEITVPVRYNGKLLTEPTLLFTKVNINRDIPYVVYEYLDWSIKIGKKMIIYVPDENKVYNVYNYLLKLKNKLHTNMDFYIENNTDKRILMNFCKKKNAILVTNYLGERYLNFSNINIMVYFADDKNFNYKKLVYLSGRLGVVETFEKGEVVFLAKKETKDIVMAKSITRNFNKEAWEMGLLNI